MRPTNRPRLAAAAGFSMAEMMISMGLLTVIMGATLAGLASIVKGNEVIMATATLNNAVRAGMDLMIRDLLQVGAGLPASHTVSIPNGANSVRVRIPGPFGSTTETLLSDTALPAVIPRSGGGPTINGIQTDVLSVLMSDNAFLEIALSSVANTNVVIAPGPVLDAGANRVVAGQLMLISKGSFNTLVQVTSIDVANRRLTFADGDSLRLNQSTAEAGNLTALNAEAPVNSAAATRISRMRLITYYLDVSKDPNHPRLMRRINNGHEWTFDNTHGTAVAIDVVNLQYTYDISNGAGNPGNVEMTNADMNTLLGACAPAACARTQVHKVNLLLTSRGQQNQAASQTAFMTNTLSSQVSLRGMAFVDRYQ